MLRTEDNEYITRIGPGTPMGALLRQYWVPAMLSSELPRPDCPPVRVLLLGEKLIGFRDSAGRVWLLSNLSLHRGASLFFARNGGSRLRCALRLEVRRRWPLHRHAERAAGQQLQGQGPGEGLPLRRARRARVGVPGTTRGAAAAPGPGGHAASRWRVQRHRLPPELQLAEGHERRNSHCAHGLPELRLGPGERL